MKCKHCDKKAEYRVIGDRHKAKAPSQSMLRDLSIPVCTFHLRKYPNRKKGYTERLS